MLTRRSFTAGALACPAFRLNAKPDSKIRGVLVGAQSYSFRDRSLDEAIRAISEIGLSYVELWSGHIEPPRGTPPEELAKWRTDPASLASMGDIRRKFNRAGIRVYALSCNLRKQNSDDEMRACMKMARALGTSYLTSSSTVDQADRLNRIAAETGVLVGLHNHSDLKNPNEFATPESFSTATAGHPQLRINLDIGHFVAANFDPLAYLKENHARIITLHLKDRKKDQGANVPFGQGDTPIQETVRLLRDNQWRIPAMIEYEYKGGDTVEEVKKCYEYVRQTLTS